MGALAEQVQHVVRMPLVALAEARGNLFPWVPVCLAVGVGLWFAAPEEPGWLAYALLAAVAAVMLAFALRGPEEMRPLAVAVLCIVTGAAASGLRAHQVAAPVLDFRYYGAITGRIIDIDRSQTDALRLTLDQVVLDSLSPEATPARVRISLRGRRIWLAPEPGQVIQTTGHLAAPEGPVEPGAFDFRRMAWFQRLGAVGYTSHPLLLLQDPGPRDQWISRLRAWFSAGIQTRIEGDAGAFASGVMTGDRSGLSLDAVEDLRASSLAHLLAISGMNLAFLIGFVFTLIRSAIALVPALALRINSKKIAAAVSLIVAWFYMMLSGANVATERAFLMVVVMLGAVLLDRRALSIRSVAVSATVLLLIRPESLLDPGFQMSYAATAALITGFAAFERQMLRQRLPVWAMPVFTLVLSSVLAGVATAPFGAAHFGRIADFGLLANLLTVPVMGAVVMPAGAVAALVAPLGLAEGPLWVMGVGSRWILHVADMVAGWEGAVTPVPTPGPWVLPLLGASGVFVVLLGGKRRVLAVLPLGVAFFLWTQVSRPPLLVSSDGRLVGLMTAQGRAVSAPKGAGFSASSWLERDGDLATQSVAAMRAGFAGDDAIRRFQIGQWQAAHLRATAPEETARQLCDEVDLIVVSAEIAQTDGRCRIIDRKLLSDTGGIAISPDGDHIELSPARAGQRLWSPRDLPAGTILRWGLPPRLRQ